MDYGNEEVLPFSDLQPLDSKFCTLPCQAINCSLKNCFPQSGVWSTHICEWITNLLLAKNVELSISECKLPNQASVEVCIPLNELRKSAILNVTLQDDILQRNSTLSLSAFMNYTRLSFAAMRLHDTTFDCTLEVSHISLLPPLVVELSASSDFTCLVSRVSNQLHFYVHPVQEELAHTMSFISDQLHTHYSVEKNRVQLSPEDVKCGSVCCVSSVKSQHWCRGVITSVKSEITSGEGLKCLIFYLDYGESEWLESSQVFKLMKSLCEYPPQVMCCCFEEVTACGDMTAEELTEAPLANPDVKGFVCDAYSCSIKQKEISSKCARFMRAATEDKQLVVFVKGIYVRTYVYLCVDSTLLLIRYR